MNILAFLLSPSSSFLRMIWGSKCWFLKNQRGSPDFIWFFPVIWYPTSKSYTPVRIKLQIGKSSDDVQYQYSTVNQFLQLVLPALTLFFCPGFFAVPGFLTVKFEKVDFTMSVLRLYSFLSKARNFAVFYRFLKQVGRHLIETFLIVAKPFSLEIRRRLSDSECSTFNFTVYKLNSGNGTIIVA